MRGLSKVLIGAFVLNINLKKTSEMEEIEKTNFLRHGKLLG